jgi:hypothetical protein
VEIAWLKRKNGDVEIRRINRLTGQLGAPKGIIKGLGWHDSAIRAQKEDE